MQSLIKNNYIIFKMDKDDKTCFFKKENLAGTVGAEFLPLKNKDNKFIHKFGFQNLHIGPLKNNPENEDKNGTLVVKSDKHNILSFPLVKDKQYAVSKNAFLAFEGNIKIIKKINGFYSKTSNDSLLIIEGEGNVFLSSNSNKILQFSIGEKYNSFSTGNILFFDNDLNYKLMKKSKSEHQVSFNGDGIIYLGT